MDGCELQRVGEASQSRARVDEAEGAHRRRATADGSELEERAASSPWCLGVGVRIAREHHPALGLVARAALATAWGTTCQDEKMSRLVKERRAGGR